jgi:hypothetical protein
MSWTVSLALDGTHQPVDVGPREEEVITLGPRLEPGTDVFGHRLGRPAQNVARVEDDEASLAVFVVEAHGEELLAAVLVEVGADDVRESARIPVLSQSAAVRPQGEQLGRPFVKGMRETHDLGPAVAERAQGVDPLDDKVGKRDPAIGDRPSGFDLPEHLALPVETVEPVRPQVLLAGGDEKHFEMSVVVQVLDDQQGQHVAGDPGRDLAPLEPSAVLGLVEEVGKLGVEPPELAAPGVDDHERGILDAKIGRLVRPAEERRRGQEEGQDGGHDDGGPGDDGGGSEVPRARDHGLGGHGIGGRRNGRGRGVQVASPAAFPSLRHYRLLSMFSY